MRFRLAAAIKSPKLVSILRLMGFSMVGGSFLPLAS